MLDAGVLCFLSLFSALFTLFDFHLNVCTDQLLFGSILYFIGKRFRLDWVLCRQRQLCGMRLKEPRLWKGAHSNDEMNLMILYTTTVFSTCFSMCFDACLVLKAFWSEAFVVHCDMTSPQSLFNKYQGERLYFFTAHNTHTVCHQLLTRQVFFFHS